MTHGSQKLFCTNGDDDHSALMHALETAADEYRKIAETMSKQPRLAAQFTSQYERINRIRNAFGASGTVSFGPLGD